jgi:hypothetical protein
MDVDPQAPQPQQQQQQQQQSSTAADGPSGASHEHDSGSDHVHAMDMELTHGPSQPWMPDSLCSLLAAAAASSINTDSMSGQQQQQQQAMLLSPAQVLVLTAHAALLECGFVYSPAECTGHASSIISGGSCSSGGGVGQLQSTVVSQCSGTALMPAQLQQLLQASGGVYALTYQLPQDSTAPAPPAAVGAAAAAGPSAGVDATTAAAAAWAAYNTPRGVSVELRGIDMGHQLVLLGSVKVSPGPTPAVTAAAGAAGADTIANSSSSSRSCKVVASLNLPKSQITPASHSEAPTDDHPAAAAAAGAAGTSNAPQAQLQNQQQPQTQQQQQQQGLAGHQVCSFKDLPRLWMQLKDGLGLPLLTASCAAAGLPAPLGLNNLTYELQEAVLVHLQVTLN